MGSYHPNGARGGRISVVVDSAAAAVIAKPKKDAVASRSQGDSGGAGHVGVPFR